VLDSLRNQCLREPQRFKFARAEVLAEEEQQSSKDNESFSYMESTADNYKGRHEKKQRCYTMVVSNAKDVAEEVRSVAAGVEEGVNMIKSESGGMQVKA
jgi:hypothetical protein